MTRWVCTVCRVSKEAMLRPKCECGKPMKKVSQ